jgi:lipopolysaccharide export system protein LptA
MIPDNNDRSVLMTSTRASLALAAALGVAVALPQAMAQNAGVPGGFQHDSSQPIKISADALEVRQNEQVAVFTGAVDARQGDVRMQAQRLVVNYDPDAEDTSEAGAIQSVRAEGDVFISSTDSTASGNWADYDVASGSITMGDTVTLTQGTGNRSNVIGGSRLIINLDTGVAQMQGGVSAVGGTGRVEMILNPAQAGQN